MTNRDPKHVANPLPWFPQGARPFLRFSYVITRGQARLLLVASLASLQHVPQTESEAIAIDALGESWWSLYWDLEEEDRMAIDQVVTNVGASLPPDPGVTR